MVALPILTHQSPEEGILGRLESGQTGIRLTCSAMDSSSSSSVLLDTSIDSSSDDSAFGSGLGKPLRQT